MKKKLSQEERNNKETKNTLNESDSQSSSLSPFVIFAFSMSSPSEGASPPPPPPQQSSGGSRTTDEVPEVPEQVREFERGLIVDRMHFAELFLRLTRPLFQKKKLIQSLDAASELLAQLTADASQLSLALESLSTALGEAVSRSAASTVEHAELLEAASAKAAASAALAAEEQEKLTERGAALAEELSGAQALSDGVAKVKARLDEVAAIVERALSIDKGGGSSGGGGKKKARK